MVTTHPKYINCNRHCDSRHPGHNVCVCVCVCACLACICVLVLHCTFQIIWGSGYTSLRDLPSFHWILSPANRKQCSKGKKIVMGFFPPWVFRNPLQDILTSNVNIYLYRACVVTERGEIWIHHHGFRHILCVKVYVMTQYISSTMQLCLCGCSVWNIQNHCYPYKQRAKFVCI